MRSGIITLTTDFGLADHYVGVMKGVIATIHPEARVVDVSHDVASHSIAEGAFTVAQAYRYFPQGTVHVVVVDPGVGTERRPIIVDAGGHHFVAPDNGVLSQVYERETPSVRSVDVERYALKPTSQTFHGRDVFAPIAARLSKGTASEEFGEVISDFVRLAPTAPRLVEPGRWQGKVLHVDRFGNLVTSFTAKSLTGSESFRSLIAGGKEVDSFAEAYALAPEGRPFVIAGSSGYLEVSINRASAADWAGIGVEDRVELVLAPGGGPGN